MDVDTWTDLGSIGVSSNSSKPYNAIDGHLFAENGAYYLTFGSWWNGLFQMQMGNAPVTTKLGSSTYQLSYDSTDKAQEAAYMFKTSDYYYLFFSKGSCCGYDKERPARGKEYRVMVCRSSSIDGGFVDKAGISCLKGGGTVILESHNWVYGPGGQGVYQDPVHGPVSELRPKFYAGLHANRENSRFCIIIMLTHESVILMGRNGSVGISSISQAAGQLCRLGMTRIILQPLTLIIEMGVACWCRDSGGAEGCWSGGGVLPLDRKPERPLTLKVPP
jgi:hypothetical protein